jgi:L-threonylcarbamoyladenylate synthase
MRIRDCNPENVCPESIVEALQILKQGGVVAHPTDTCYGLAVDVFNEAAIQKLYEIKQMPLIKPVSILVRSIEEAEKYGKFSDMAKRMARDFWPGPLTLIVPRREEGLPDFLNHGSPGIGLRVIDDSISVALLNAIDGPLTTTSANLHGHPTPFLVDEISAMADFVLDVGQLRKHENPSTVMEIQDDRATILRQGDFSELYSGAIDGSSSNQ